MTDNYSELIPEVDDPKLEAVARFFCRHLVSLSGWYYLIDANEEPIGELQFFSYSGFIFSIRDTWYFVTAGHILEELQQHLSNKNIKVTEYILIDTFGPNVKSHYPIKFDYESAPQFYIHDKEAGLDFGLVVLSPYYKELLKANNIVPVSEENWIHQHEVEFSDHIMLGLPKVFIKTERQADETNEQIIGSVSPVLIPITRLSNTSIELPKTTYPRFVGRLGDDFPLDDIDGMSGGPILGFNKEGDTSWIVAIQSSQLRSSNLSRNKIIFACPVPVFATLIEEIITSQENELKVQTDSGEVTL